MTSEHDAAAPPQIDFVTLGMFIIDDIYPSPTALDQTPSLNISGGAGTYSALGARLLSPPPLSPRISWTIDHGPDFPLPLRTTLTSWRTTIHWRPRPDATTRGWNGYGPNEHRAFHYLTPKKRLTAADLTPAQLGSRSFHLICSPTRCISLISTLLARRQTELHLSHKPRIIWEPVPDLCVPAELPNTYAALQHVDVISPNHEELNALFAETPYTIKSSPGFDKQAVERQASQFLAHGVGPRGEGAVVVRAGSQGVFVASLDKRKWLPAYHQDAARVVDPTGGGNGFLGAFAVGLVRTEGDLVEAARWGSVGASLCIEQVGMPGLTEAEGEREGERWNGCSVQERLREYKRRTS